MSEVRFEETTKRFGNVTAVLNLSLVIEEGEFVTLLGPSGCGKTTTLRLLAGFYPPSAGRILIGGAVTSDIERGVFVPPGRRGVGMVFQDYALWPHMSVAANVGYPLRIAGRSRSEIRGRVGQMLELVRMSGLEERFPHELSGGQQQRVALARALAAGPRVLLLDEPLSNLDASLRESMRVEIKSIHQRLGVTVLFVTHDQEEAMSLSDRIVVMQEGCVHQIGAPEDLFDSPADEFVASFVGKANFFEIRREGRALYFLRGTEIREPLSADRFEGEPVKSRACAKPSDIRISSPCADGILGRVESSLFLGASVVYYVRVGPYRFRVSTGRRGLAPGSEVSLSFKKVILF